MHCCAGLLLLISGAAALYHRQIDAWGANAVRVRVVVAGDAIGQPAAQGLLPDAPVGTPHATVSDGGRITTNGNLRVTVDASTGTATFTRVSDGTVLFTESALTMATPAPLNDSLAPTSRGAITFHNDAARGEYFYGFGEHRGTAAEGCTNQCTNSTLPLRKWHWKISDSQDVSALPNNGNAWIPYFSSSRGFGFLWNSAGYGRVSIDNDPFMLEIGFDAVQQVDYWVSTTAAPVPATVATPPYRQLMQQYAAVTGSVPQLPHTYTGFWQCKLRYSSQEQIERVTQGYKQRGLPISVIVIDYHHWAHEGDWRFCDDADIPAADRCTGGCWPDPAGMVRNLTAAGVTLAVSVWPDVDTQSINYGNMSAAGLLIRGRDGRAKVSAQGKYYIDAFNGAARDYLFQQLRRGYVRHGIDTFWMDATEPQGANIGEWAFALSSDGDETGAGGRAVTLHADAEVGMAWVQQYHRMAREGLQRLHPGEQALAPFLTRSAFAGSQRYGAILWSGDIESSFDELATQVHVAQHVAMSGLPLWTTDIGGFREGDNTDPKFRELIVRWFQFGAFCPIFRLHGHRDGAKDHDRCATEGYNEVWEFGDEAFAAISDVMRLRESLRPYVQAGLDLAHTRGTPLLRPMVFDFGDAECVNATTQYMFGEDYLVAPVLEYRGVSRPVFLPTLPEGHSWVHHYTGETFEGGTTHTVPTTNLSQFPLFKRTIKSSEVMDESLEEVHG